MENKEENVKDEKKKNSKLKKILLIDLIVIFICCLGYVIYFIVSANINKGESILKDVKIDQSQITENKTEKMLQLEEMQKENSDIIGWLEIADTNINYPVLQTTDNDYYLTHTYDRKYSSTGSLFLDKDFDLTNKSSNYLIYGHRSTKGTMFEDLMKYAKKDFYESHKQIKFTTNEEEATYEVLAVFYSRVYYQNETNVFRYYYFVNAENEAEYDDFVNNAKKASIYDTGVTAEYGDQLMTLSTCEYSQEDGRFAVVLKKMDLEQ